MPAGEIPIRGRHNAENVLAASIAAARAGVSPAAIAAAVRSFRAVEHRLEFVRSVSGVEFYNDSKATSVDATLKAVDAFSGGLWVILGGKDKGLEYTGLRAPLAAKAHALLQGRGYVTPQDVKSIGPDILRHRVIVTYEAEAEDIDADAVVKSVFDGVPVP